MDTIPSTKPKPYKFVVRLPIALRSRIAEAAQYHRRSMNSEIVARLEHSFSALLGAQAAEDMAPEMHEALESFFASALTQEEEGILRAYRRLPQIKKDALHELLT